MKKTLTALAAAATVLLAGCSPTPATEPTRADIYEDVQREAEYEFSSEDEAMFLKAALTGAWAETSGEDRAIMCGAWLRDPEFALRMLSAEDNVDLLTTREVDVIVTDHFDRVCGR